MCLIIDRNKQSKIADRDIQVYKVLNANTKAMYYDFQYTKDVLKITQFGIGDMQCADSVAGAQLKDEFGPDWNFKEDILRSIGRGFHFCFTLGRAEKLLKSFLSFGRIVGIHEFIVPKGAEYYEDNSGLGVSNQIILKDQVILEHENLQIKG